MVDRDVKRCPPNRRYIVRNTGGATLRQQAANAILQGAIVIGDPFVLSQVLQPRLNVEQLDKVVGPLGIFILKFRSFRQATSRSTAAISGFVGGLPVGGQSRPKPSPSSAMASARRTSAKANSVVRCAA